MNCQDMEKFIHVYLDREFAEEDRADFERHLAECERCRQLARFEQRFKQQLKTGLARPHLRLDERESLRLRLMSTLDNAPPLPARSSMTRWALRVVPAAAAAVLVFTLILQERSPTGRHAASLLKALTLPRSAVQPKVKSQDPVAVRDWYRNKLDFRIDPPKFRDGHTSLVGARLGQAYAQQAAHLIYQRDGRRVNVMMFRPSAGTFQDLQRRQIGGKTVYYGQHQGQNVAAFFHQGVAYSIASDLPRGQLDRLVQDVLTPRALPDEVPTSYDALPASAPGGP